jgi:hypothetical protein
MVYVFSQVFTQRFGEHGAAETLKPFFRNAADHL